MPDKLTPLISKTEIAAAVQQIAEAIDRDYQDCPPVLVVTLRGAFMFAADLARAIQVPIHSIEFIRVSSYGSATVSSGHASIIMGLEPEAIANQHVIVIEDIIDTGTTAAKMLQEFQSYQPASLKLCALLDKPDRRKVAISIDYSGITIPDRFIIGYGIDFNQRYRQLPEIYTINE